ncbi:MAG: DUF5110 domain-containing protein [Phycisphaerales bacterium]|nr:DUF5110 domain-containing protein [Phycisphaerales bacterium]
MRLIEMRADNSTTRARAGAMMMACGLALGASVAVIGGCASGPTGTEFGDGRYVEQLSNAKDVVCYYASKSAASEALPSMALQRPRTARGGTPGKATSPLFSVENGRQTAKVRVDAGTSLYGTGEVGGPLLRNGRRVECWNTDAYGYGSDSPSLYKSHPWVLGVRADGTAFGVLADTTYRCEIDLTSVNDNGGEIVFRAVGPSFPVIVIERNSPQDVVKTLGELTGRIEMPPKWAIGYHQCRYSYEPDTRVMEIASGFRSRDIPCDVIWHDIDYMNKYMCFTFDPVKFSNPTRHNADLHKLGFHTVWMIDPGIGAEKAKHPAGGYSVYESGTAIDAWVKRADGTTYQGEVWPGWCVFPDYTREQTRTWWAGLYKDFMATGIDGVWNDMNEPAVFNVPTKTMPEDNAHRADAELGGPGSHAQFHNVYGMLMVKATRDGIMATNPDKRPFVLSRAGYIGSHRYAASWTGDNKADWEHLADSVPMALNLSLSGQPFVGPDIGGFDGNGPKGEEGKLFGRWMGFGALLPFSRGHTAKGNIDKEPWAFGPQVEETCRQAISMRYRLLPYYYTLFHEAATTGLPVARPLFFADPLDRSLRAEDDSFLIGDALLVGTQPTREGGHAIKMPKGEWAPMNEALGAKDAEVARVFLKEGSILPTGPAVEFADEKPLDPLTLYVVLDKDGKASGTLYEDAGEGWGFKKGEYLLTTYTASSSGKDATIRVKSSEGALKRPSRNVNVVVMMKKEGQWVSYAGSGKDGTDVKVTLWKW